MNDRPGTSHEDELDQHDWEAFRRLAALTGRWWWPGWRPSRRYCSWSVLLDTDPGLARLVGQCQRALDLPYLAPVPPEGLHLAVQGVAFTDEITADQAAEIGQRARTACDDLTAFTLTVGPLAGDGEGVFLRAAPWLPVRRLRSRLRTAVATVLGEDRVPDEPARFAPHTRVAHCNAAVPAAELIERVRRLRALPPVPVTVDAVHLVELSREHRTDRRDVTHTVRLRA